MRPRHVHNNKTVDKAVTRIVKAAKGAAINIPVIPHRVLLHFFHVCVATQMALCLFYSDQSYAADLHLHGFGTLGASHSDSEQYGWRPTMDLEGSYDGQWEVANNSILGVQLDGVVSPRLKGSLQLVARQRQHQGLDDVVEWAYLGYGLSDSLDLRVGRMGLGNYLLSDYRNVRFAQLWTHPPTEYYGQLPHHHSDGIDITWSHHDGDGLWRWRTGAGVSDLSFYVGDSFSGSEGKVDSVDLAPGYLTALSYETQSWRAQISLTAARLDDNFRSGKPLRETYAYLESLGFEGAGEYATQFETKGEWAYYAAAGVAYDNGRWLLQAEINQIDSPAELINSSTNGYLSLGRRLSSVTVYGVYGYAHSVGDAPQAPQFPIPGAEQLAAISDLISRTTRANQQTLALGLRWDLHPQLALKGQWDRTWLERDGVMLFGLNDLDQPLGDARVDTFSLQLDFVF